MKGRTLKTITILTLRALIPYFLIALLFLPWDFFIKPLVFLFAFFVIETVWLHNFQDSANDRIFEESAPYLTYLYIALILIAISCLSRLSRSEIGTTLVSSLIYVYAIHFVNTYSSPPPEPSTYFAKKSLYLTPRSLLLAASASLVVHYVAIPLLSSPENRYLSLYLVHSSVFFWLPATLGYILTLFLRKDIRFLQKSAVPHYREFHMQRIAAFLKTQSFFLETVSVFIITSIASYLTRCFVLLIL